MKKPTPQRNVDKLLDIHVEFLNNTREPLEAAKVRFTSAYFADLEDNELAKAIASELVSRFGDSGNVLWLNIKNGLRKAKS